MAPVGANNFINILLISLNNYKTPWRDLSIKFSKTQGKNILLLPAVNGTLELLILPSVINKLMIWKENIIPVFGVFRPYQQMPPLIYPHLTARNNTKI